MSLAASRRSAVAGALPLRAAAALCQHCNSNSNSNGSNNEMNMSCYCCCCRESSEIMCVNSRRASVSTPTATTTTTPSTIKLSAVANKKTPSQASSTSNKIQARQQKFLAAAAASSRASHPKLAPSSAPPAQCDRSQPQKVATSVRQQQRTSAAALSTPTVSSLAPSSQQQQQQPQVAASAHESRSQLGASSQRQQQQQPPTATIDRQFQQQQQAGSAKFIYNNNICQQTATTTTTTTTSQGQCHNQSTIALNPNSSSTTLTSSSLVQPTTTTTTSTENQHRQRSGQPSAAASSNNNQQQQQNHNQNLANQTQHHQPSQQHQSQQNHQPRQHFAMSQQHQHHHQQQQHSHNITHYKYHNDCQSSVLTYEQVKRLDFVMDQIVPIHGRGNFPTLYIKLKELIRMVKYKLQTEHSIEIRDVRLNGGAASYVLAPENSHYNDLDLVFGTDLSDETSFDVMRDIVLECLRDIFQKTTTHNFLKQQQHQLLLQPSPISNIGSSLSASNNIQNHNIADNYNHHIQFNQQQQHHYQATTQTNNVDQQSRTTGPLIENNRQRTVVCNEGKNNDPYGQEQKVDNIKNTKNININNNDNYNTEMMIDTATKVESDKNQLNNHTGSSKTKNTTTLQKSHNAGQLKTTTTSTSSSVIDKENINATKCAKKHDTTNGLRITQMSQTNDNDMTTGTTKSTLYPRSDNNGSSDDNVVRSSSFDEQQQNLKNWSQPTTVDSSCNLNQEDQRVTRDLKREGCGAGDSNSDGQTSETRLVALETSADASISECNLPDSKKKANIDKFKSNYEQQDEQQQRQQQQQQRLEQEYFVQQNQPPIQYHYNQMPLSDCAIKEAYVHKMVKVNDDDRWSLISLGVQQSESSNSTAIESSVEINNTCQDNVSCQQQEKMQPQLVIQGCSLQRLQHNQQYHPSIAAFSYPQNNNQQRQTCNQQQNQSPNSIELKFVDRMRRKFEFSVDSFQIILDSLLEFYDYAPQASITSSYEYPQQELQRDSFSSAQSHAGTNSIISNDGVNSNCSSGCCCCEGGCIGRRTDEMIDSNDCTNRGAKGICHEVSDFMPSEDEQNLNSNQNSNHHKHDHHNDLPLDQQMSSTVSSSGCSSSSSVVSSSSSSLSYDDDHEDLYGDADISPSSSVSTSSLISSTNMSMLSSDSKRPRNERGRSGDGIDTGFVGCRNAAIKALPRTTRTSQAINKQGEAKNTLCMEQSRSSYNLKQGSKLHQVANNVSSGFSGDVQGDFPNLKHHNQTTNDMNQNDEFLNSHNCHRLSCGDDIMSRNGYCSHYAAMSNGSCSGSSRYGDASSLYGDIELSGASSCAVISENFYPTVIGRSEYGDFKEALYHLERKLIATRSPEEIRGGGLLKYCNLLVKSYKPTNAYQIRTLERYMCSRFFIDFSDLNQQQAKLESYLANHFSDDPRLKFDYLTILHSIVQRSTVCLMNHELRLTLNMIRDLACKLHEQQLQRRRLQQQQQQQSQQQQQQKQPVPLLLGTMNMVLVSIRPHSGMRQPSSNPTA